MKPTYFFITLTVLFTASVLSMGSQAQAHGFKDPSVGEVITGSAQGVGGLVLMFATSPFGLLGWVTEGICDGPCQAEKVVYAPFVFSLDVMTKGFHRAEGTLGKHRHGRARAR